MKKTEPARAEREATPSPAPAAAVQPPAPLPAEGGSWVRQPDGSLVREKPAVKGA